MSIYDEWDARERNRGWGLASAGMGALRVALLFGSAAVALALILTPIMENRTKSRRAGHPGLDFTSTGSIGQYDGAPYVIRRSVLQPTPQSVCIIGPGGARSGDC